MLGASPDRFTLWQDPEWHLTWKVAAAVIILGTLKGIIIDVVAAVSATQWLVHAVDGTSFYAAEGALCAVYAGTACTTCGQGMEFLYAHAQSFPFMHSFNLSTIHTAQ